jgi:hypothetical protein
VGGTDQRMLAKMQCGSGTVPCLGLFLPYLLAMSPVGFAPEVGGTDQRSIELPIKTRCLWQNPSV